MKLDLNNLLDIDTLTPLQEREIRKLIHYELSKTGKVYMLKYIVKGQVNDSVVVSFDIKLLKIKSYKKILYTLISHYGKEVENLSLIAGVDISSFSQMYSPDFKFQQLYNLLIKVKSWNKKGDCDE